MDAPKKELRRALKQRRLALHPSYAPSLQRQAIQQLPRLLPEGKALGLYWPLPGEVDLRSLADLTALADRIALPCITGGVALSPLEPQRSHRQGRDRHSRPHER